MFRHLSQTIPKSISKTSLIVLRYSKCYSSIRYYSIAASTDFDTAYINPNDYENSLLKNEPNPIENTTSLTITDPLVIYQNYVARGILRGDESQLRAAKEFQNLYYRVKDYVPENSNLIKMRAVFKDIETKMIFKKHKEGLLQNWFSKVSESINLSNSHYNKYKKTKSLVKVLNDEEQVYKINAPLGFLLNGEVGCGKSMLMDIFAASLPHSSKGRWHYNNFMLWVYDQINTIQKRRSLINNFANTSTAISFESELVLFEIASNMINKNSILLLDEFMLPDLAAAKIVKLLFTYFFQLGGVLVATSNRLPEELYSNKFKKSEFTSFLTILQYRCSTMDMKSFNDYRSILSEESKDLNIEPYLIVKDQTYKDSTQDKEWNKLLDSIIDMNKGLQNQIKVYGRNILIPWQYNGVAKFDFDYICKGLFGPGDYITLASNYHTFIIDNVPIMTLQVKNEAKRFITLLDALYECKCRLILRTETSPDGIFFPEIIEKSLKDNQNSINNNVEEIENDVSNRIDVQNEEMYSKTQMDLMAPYRPNVSSYEDGTVEYKSIPSSCKFETNFKDIKKFTGEDEKFAYKRAVSRIKEMTGSIQWRSNEINKWKPLNLSMRPWEELSKELKNKNIPEFFDGGLSGKSLPPDYSELINHGIEPLTDTIFGKDAPKFKPNHIWSLGLWGKGERIKDQITKKWIRGTESTES
ncbi:uncharacterized protein ASCRUDRAFT_77984 [Ascoidea rubescens DSM 1968]|uniref:AFG1-like ATPase n=1 Tax=Ascoidea rubescens DSM 1968 TaxID=1344418 RepID=A0A1D2V9F6_9ASCO|nr:hypothetical protein ASCRUDRAFT_77984 [Ascoidea rubescens DSM 1968]ODV58284.1 hypothetical protein ASCRUDRAFT_77984 [Ascoidea rubescens DSM 1968]